MKERIIEFLKKENKTASQFAEEINVQPSGISHILSGRNKPSLDFVLKMLEKYPYISSDWLLFGNGEMYRDKSLATLFDSFDEKQSLKSAEERENDETIQDDRTEKPSETDSGTLHPRHSEVKTTDNSCKISKIVFFYKDRTFEEFFPAGS